MPILGSDCLLIEGVCYHYINSKLNYQNAQITCQANNGKLFEPKNKLINDMIYDGITNYYGIDTRLWIGINDLSTEGTFVYSSDGSNLTFTNWAPSQPKNLGGTEDCVDLRTEWDEGIWTVANCDDLISAICQIGAENEDLQISSEGPTSSFITTFSPAETTANNFSGFGPGVVTNVPDSISTANSYQTMNISAAMTTSEGISTSEGTPTTTYQLYTWPPYTSYPPNTNDYTTTYDLSYTSYTSTDPTDFTTAETYASTTDISIGTTHTTSNTISASGSTVPTTTDASTPYPMTCGEIDGFTVCN